MLFIFQDTVLWACLATMAAYAKDLNTAETAYAAIDEVCTEPFVTITWAKVLQVTKVLKVRTVFMTNRLTKCNTLTTSKRFLPRKEETLQWLSSADSLKKQRPSSCKLDLCIGQYRWILTSSIGTGTQHTIGC